MKHKVKSIRRNKIRRQKNKKTLRKTRRKLGKKTMRQKLRRRKTRTRARKGGTILDVNDLVKITGHPAYGDVAPTFDEENYGVGRIVKRRERANYNQYYIQLPSPAPTMTFHEIGGELQPKDMDYIYDENYVEGLDTNDPLYQTAVDIP